MPYFTRLPSVYVIVSRAPLQNIPAAEAGRGAGGGGEAAGAFGTIVSTVIGSAALDAGSLEADALAVALLQRASYFPEDLVMLWFVQLLLALHHLHGRKIMHRGGSVIVQMFGLGVWKSINGRRTPPLTAGRNAGDEAKTVEGVVQGANRTVGSHSEC